MISDQAVVACATGAADRASVVGVRQLRDAVQGLRPEGRPARPVREGRRRGPGPPLHRRRADASPSTSRGTRSTTTRTWPATPPISGSRLGTINSNVFQDDDYMLGSVCNPDPRVRRKALDHLLACIDIMDATGSRDLKLWFSDGTNYPGQDDIRARQDRLAEALAAVHARLGAGPADAPRVQALRAVVLHDGRARTGAPRSSSASRPGRRRRSSSTPATTRRARTSSSSSRRCCGPAGSAGSTSTRGSTPTTT